MALLVGVPVMCSLRARDSLPSISLWMSAHYAHHMSQVRGEGSHFIFESVSLSTI